MAEQNEEFARIRGYLQQQAAARTIDDLIERVEEAAAELHAAAEAIDEARFTAVPPGETWTPLDCLTHSVESDLSNCAQIQLAAHEGRLPTERGLRLPAKRQGLLAEHRHGLDGLYASVRSAAPDANLGLTWEHPFFGQLNWREWLIFLRIHCRDHARQLDAMRTAFGS